MLCCAVRPCINDMCSEASHIPYHCKIRRSYFSQLLRDSISSRITVSQQCRYRWRVPHSITIMAQYNIHTSCNRYRHATASTMLATKWHRVSEGREGDEAAAEEIHQRQHGDVDSNCEEMMSEADSHWASALYQCEINASAMFFCEM